MYHVAYVFATSGCFKYLATRSLAMVTIPSAYAFGASHAWVGSPFPAASAAEW